MKITVITVCYNAASTLRETIESVLGQTYCDIEYIIIDGGSTDGSTDIIKEYSDRLASWVSEPDNGIYDAMNKGIEHSNGDYILFMNSGDRFFDSEVVATVVNKIRRETELSGHAPDIVYGETVGKKSGEKYFTTYTSPTPFVNDIGACHQSIFTSGRYMRMIKFDTRYRLRADYDFFRKMRLEHNASIMYVHRYISIYDYSGISASWNNLSTLRREQLAIQGRPFPPLAFALWALRLVAGNSKSYLITMIVNALYPTISFKNGKYPIYKTLESFQQFDD